MSTALAVAGVTAVLRGMLESWLGDQNANAALGGANADVTAVAPDTIELTGPNATPRLNLFLHQVSQNAGWRNVQQPSLDSAGNRTSSPPLALDLHYLLTAYGPAELQSEVLLGYGMQRLHHVPVLDRQEIAARLPAALQGSNLGRQMELIKVTPVPMGSEELSKLWTALQAKYRPSAAYHVSVVLIETPTEGRAPQPVLSRGPIDPVTNREQGIVAVPDVWPSVPVLGAVRPSGGQLGAELNQSVDVDGRNLGGIARTAILDSRIHDVIRDVSAAAGTSPTLVTFTVPNAPVQLPAGVYALRVRIAPSAGAPPRETNTLPLAIVPSIVSATLVSVDAQRTATITINVRPQVRPYQAAALLIEGRAVPSEPHPATTAALTFVVTDTVPGSYLVGVRVDGIDSVLVNQSVTPPAFAGTTLVIP